MTFFDQKKSPSIVMLVISKVTAAELFMAAGRIADATQLLDKAVGIAARGKGLNRDRVLAIPLISIGLAKRAIGQPADGLHDVQRSCDIFDSTLGPAKFQSLRCRAIAAWLAAEATPVERRAQAVEQFEAAKTALERALPDGHALKAELTAIDADLSEGTGRSAEARTLRSSAARAYQQAVGAPLPTRLVVLH